MTVTLTADERLSHSKWMSRCRPNAASVKGSCSSNGYDGADNGSAIQADAAET